MVPSLGVKLSDNPALFEEVWTRGTKVLRLESGAEAGRAALSAGPDVGAPRRSPANRNRGKWCDGRTLRRSWAKDLDAATLVRTAQAAGRGVRRRAGLPYPELDGQDLLAETRHFWLEQPDGEVIATLRLMENILAGARASASGGCAPSAPPAGRTTPPGCCRYAGRRWVTIPHRINAQTYLADMYLARFRRRRREFLEDGIPHVPMLKHSAS